MCTTDTFHWQCLQQFYVVEYKRILLQKMVSLLITVLRSVLLGVLQYDLFHWPHWQYPSIISTSYFLHKTTCTITRTPKASCLHDLVLPRAMRSGGKFELVLSVLFPSVMACIRLGSWLARSSLGGSSNFWSTPKMVHSGRVSSSRRIIRPMSRTLGSPLSFKPFSFLKCMEREKKN